MNILTIFVFMLFGFNVVSLYYIIKMYNMIRFYTFNMSNNVFCRQEDLKQLDIFGLMTRLSNQDLINQLSNIGHTLLEKDSSLKAILGYSVHEKEKRLLYATIENATVKLTVSMEQDAFISDNAALFKITSEQSSETYSEFFTHETFFLDWMSETFSEFDWLKVEKIEHKS